MSNSRKRVLVLAILASLPMTAAVAADHGGPSPEQAFRSSSPSAVVRPVAAGRAPTGRIAGFDVRAP